MLTVDQGCTGIDSRPAVCQNAPNLQLQDMLSPAWKILLLIQSYSFSGDFKFRQDQMVNMNKYWINYFQIRNQNTVCQF